MKLSTIVQGQYQHMSAEYLISFETFRLKIKIFLNISKASSLFLTKNSSLRKVF
jgi:hypothetical protein